MAFKDDLTAWKALLLTARTGKISQTAVLMLTTPSKISRLLSGLRDELGYELFDVSKRPLVPTPRCQQVLAALEPLLKDFEEVQSKSFGETRKTLIRVAAPLSKTYKNLQKA